jgi:8-oxo-dGTP pyrophosphatase MutT (NUDIX family)
MVMRIEAAGAVVTRPTASGGVEVLIVHRPRYDDWSLPKGKAEPSDIDLAATAVREVAEETGFVVQLGDSLPSIEYVDRKGRPKTVSYWRAVVVEGEFHTNSEVDEIAWIPPEQAEVRLTYARDAELVTSAFT